MLEFGFYKASIIFWAFGITGGRNKDETRKNVIVTEKVCDRLYSLHQEMEFVESTPYNLISVCIFSLLFSALYLEFL